MPAPHHSFSTEWWLGYHCMGPKSRNPYKAGQPWLAEHPDPVILKKIEDWDDGWQTRFYGEKPHDDC
jgi:hypothetical protein